MGKIGADIDAFHIKSVHWNQGTYDIFSFYLKFKNGQQSPLFGNNDKPDKSMEIP